MVLLIVLIGLTAMITSDYLIGKREGPRPTRVKLVYGLLIIMILYHTVVNQEWLHWVTYYDAANAVLKPPSDALIKWFKPKG
ncbi:hypothetical protein ACFPYJ_08695 [Paenibacillus solisilvae]|uniref:Uncharacterized protein n=1 Tax=Paenibacillus solisilvae TaxID=2486751 RepID=A0ABW0VTN0_9BACL